MMSARILVVEDDVLLRDAVDIILSQIGYQVTGVSSGEEGLAQIARVNPQLILLDVRLPKMSGVDTLRALRKAGHKMPILMLTGDSSPATVRDVLADGGNGYILKPFDPELLLKRVTATLNAA